MSFTHQVMIAILLSCAWDASVGAQPACTSLANDSVVYTVPDKPYVVLRRGPLEVVIVDNQAVDDDVLPAHRAGYHGVASLKHTEQPRNLFVPSFSGLNFEHIHDGTVQPREILFEPRHAAMQLRVIGRTTAELYQPPTPHWGLESCMRYQVLDGGVIELTFECIPRRDTFANGYIGLFWASYIECPESLDIHFLGRSEDAAAVAPAQWIRGVTPWHGVSATHRPAGDTRTFAHGPAFPLPLPFGFSQHRYTQPWYFGTCRGMALAQIFRPDDQVWFSQSPSGGGDGRPAWDFQFYIPDYEIGRRYQLVMRAIYLPAAADPSRARAAVQDAVQPFKFATED